MDKLDHRPGSTIAKSGRLHPIVPKIVGAVALWSVLGACYIFLGDELIPLTVLVVIVITGIAALPPYNAWWALWRSRARQRTGRPRQGRNRPSRSRNGAKEALCCQGPSSRAGTPRSTC